MEVVRAIFRQIRKFFACLKNKLTTSILQIKKNLVILCPEKILQ